MKYSLQEALRDLGNPNKKSNKNLKESFSKTNWQKLFNSNVKIGNYFIELDNVTLLEYEDHISDNARGGEAESYIKTMLQKDLNAIENMSEPYKQFLLENLKNNKLTVSFEYIVLEENSSDNDPLSDAIRNYKGCVTQWKDKFDWENKYDPSQIYYVFEIIRGDDLIKNDGYDLVETREEEVVPASKFHNLQEVIKYCNDNNYFLASKVAREEEDDGNLDAEIIYVNDNFDASDYYDGYGIDYAFDDDDNYYEIDNDYGYSDWEYYDSDYLTFSLLDIIKAFNLKVNFINYNKPLNKFRSKTQYQNFINDTSSNWVDAWNSTN